MDSLFPELQVSETLLGQAAVAVVLNESQATHNQLRSNNPFVLENNLRLNHIGIRKINLEFNETGWWIWRKSQNIFIDFGFGLEHELFVKQIDGSMQVRVDSGNWRNVEAKRELRDGRFTVKCSIDGQLSSFSAVISPEEVSIFNAVRILKIEFNV